MSFRLTDALIAEANAPHAEAAVGLLDLLCDRRRDTGEHQLTVMSDALDERRSHLD